MPRIEALRYTFSRPVRSGWKPAPSSSSAASRPRRSHGAGGRLDDAADDLEQRALARAVGARSARRSCRPGSTRSTSRSAQKSPVWPLRPAAVDEPLLERLVLAEDEALGDVLDADDVRRGRHVLTVPARSCPGAGRTPAGEPEQARATDAARAIAEPQRHVGPGRAGRLRPPTCPLEREHGEGHGLAR